MTALPQTDWADTLRELARFASDRELPAPLRVEISGDDATHLSVAVSGPAHAAWFEYFGQGHDVKTAEVANASWHQSHGLINASLDNVYVDLACFAHDELPSAVSA